MMSPIARSATVTMNAGESLPFDDIEGTALAVVRGTLWITQENDTRDVVLRTGDVWMVEREGLTIVEAQSDATFHAIGPAHERVRVAASARSPIRRFGQSLARWFFSLDRTVPHY